jgi:3-deoxy-D-manno-octulosonate 8-phosphate phosphatase (KDO 8-P phosphatase)
MRVAARIAGHRKTAARRQMRNPETLRDIKAFALDVDGVLTDGRIWWGPDGEEWKQFHFLDIMGISRAGKAGLIFALISGEDSPLVDRYARKMNIAHVYKGCKDKAQAFGGLAKVLLLEPSQIAFMGDDINDLPAMELSGFSAAPATAHPDVKKYVDYVTQANGGHGAVREVLDLWMNQNQ